MNRFTNTTLDQFRRLFNEKMAEIEKETGVTVKMGNMRYTATSFTSKIEAAILNGEADTIEEDSFKRECRRYGLSPEDFGRKFMSRGITYKITGLKTARRKYPISAVQLGTNRGYKFGASTVKNGLL